MIMIAMIYSSIMKSRRSPLSSRSSNLSPGLIRHLQGKLAVYGYEASFIFENMCIIHMHHYNNANKIMILLYDTT